MPIDYDAEWRKSPAAKAGLACPDCHDHRARGGHDARWLRQAVDVVVTEAESGLNVTLTAQDVGHRVPTGDLFRHLVVGSRSNDGTLLGWTLLARELALDPFRVVRDTRLVPGVPKTVRVPEGRVFVELRLVDPVDASFLPDHEVRTVVCDPCRVSIRVKRAAHIDRKGESGGEFDAR
ncbi:MAG: hypothetical protein AAGA48_32855 [Myxococcota bacterium]